MRLRGQTAAVWLHKNPCPSSMKKYICIWPAFTRLYVALSFTLTPAASLAADEAAPPFRIEHSTILTSPPDLHFAQSHAALIPGNPPCVLLTTQQIEKVGSHGYRDVFTVETNDGGKTWSELKRI